MTGPMKADMLVNLLPEERPALRLDPLLLVLLLIVAGASVGFASYGQHLRQSAQSHKANIARMSEEVKQLRASLPLVEERRARVGKLNDQVKQIQSLSSDPPRYASLLREVAQMLPPNIFLSSLSVEPDNRAIIVAGAVQEPPGQLPPAAISELLKRLQGSPRFFDARLSRLSHSQVNGGPVATFRLQLHYNPAAPDSKGGL